jgi:hypothetical protein
VDYRESTTGVYYSISELKGIQRVEIESVS